MWLRQVAMVAANLSEAEYRLKAVLNFDAAYSDEGVEEFGLKNIVVPTGNSFVEVVSPFQEETAAGRMLTRRGGDCGYMLLFQVEDLEPVSERVLSRGLRKIWETERSEVSAFHVHPKDMGGAIVSFDEMRPVDEWVWAGPDWQDRRARATGDLLSVTLEVEAPDQVASLWAELLGTTPERSRHGYYLRMSDGAEVRLEPPAELPARGIIALELCSLKSSPNKTLEDGKPIDLCGVDVSIRPNAALTTQ